MLKIAIKTGVRGAAGCVDRAIALCAQSRGGAHSDGQEGNETGMAVVLYVSSILYYVAFFCSAVHPHERGIGPLFILVCLFFFSLSGKRQLERCRPF